jgi:hypothetical protein
MDAGNNGTDLPVVKKMVKPMSNTKTVLGLIAGVAAAAIICVLASSSKAGRDGRTRTAAIKAAWNENTTDSFTGWLERLKLAIDNELKQETKRLHV